MTRSNLAAILRQLSVRPPCETDGELLARFVAGRNEADFAALVERHGRLVWSVCRQLAGAEADDAFQATFLILLRKAATLRTGTNLPAWLHGVAYRVCAKARESARRRSERERASAANDRELSVVPDSVWDRTLRIVHDEVVRLPDSQRIPFVLCCLEGKSVSDAAEQLGWKLGTLSGRLTRAKDALMARLLARDVIGGAASLAALAASEVAVPAQTAANAAQLIQPGTVVAGSILHLTQGAIGMSVYPVKYLAAGILVACGLGLSGGAGWFASTVAQTPSSAPAISPDERVRQLEAQLRQARQDAEEARKDRAKSLSREGAGTVLSTTRNEYSFVPASRMDATQFVKFLEDRESRGWDFRGQMTLQQDGKDAAVWVFGRPLNRTAPTSNNPFVTYPYTIQPPAAYGGVRDYYPVTPKPPATTKPAPRNELPPEPLDRNPNHPDLLPGPLDRPASVDPGAGGIPGNGAPSTPPPAQPEPPKKEPPLPNRGR